MATVTVSRPAHKRRLARVSPRYITRWIVFAVLALCLIASALLQGGVDPMQWEWIAGAISAASLLCLAVQSSRISDSGTRIEFRIMAALLFWMLFQVTPLPPSVIAFLSPKAWEFAKAARITTGYDLNAWLPLSVAPA